MVDKLAIGNGQRPPKARNLTIQSEKTPLQDPGSMTEKAPTGLVRSVDPTTGIPLEVSYRRGRLHGPWRSFNLSGQMTCEAHFRANVLHGSYRVWADNGQIIQASYFRRGEFHGLAQTWTESGKLRESVTFAFGVPLLQGLSRVPAVLRSGGKWSVVFRLIAVLLLLVLCWKLPFLFVCFFVLYLVIGIHELGHALAARHAGIWLSELVVGIGPSLLEFHWGSTRVRWRLLPVFGYVLPRQLTAHEHQALHRFSRELREKGGWIEEPVHVPGRIRRPNVLHVSFGRGLAFYLGGITIQCVVFVPLLLASLLLPGPNQEFAISVPLESAQGQINLLTKTEEEYQLATELLEFEAQRAKWIQLERELRPRLRDDDEAAIEEWVAVLKQRSVLEDRISVQRDQLARTMFGRRERESQYGIFEEVGRRFVKASPQEAVATFAWINFWVAVFNLLPIPGFDGFHTLRLVLARLFGRQLPNWLRYCLVAIAVMVGLAMLIQFAHQLLSEVIRSLNR